MNQTEILKLHSSTSEMKKSLQGLNYRWELEKKKKSASIKASWLRLSSLEQKEKKNEKYKESFKDLYDINKLTNMGVPREKYIQRKELNKYVWK